MPNPTKNFLCFVQAQASVITAVHLLAWCLPIRCLETGSPIVACMFISEGTCLPSCCLAMNYSGLQASCHIQIVILGGGGEERVLLHVINNMPTYIAASRTLSLVFVV
jgi:hypothetical protein